MSINISENDIAWLRLVDFANLRVLALHCRNISEIDKILAEWISCLVLAVKIPKIYEYDLHSMSTSVSPSG